jgi:hypothetical protein
MDAMPDPSSLQERVRRIEDRQEIHDLVMRFAYYIDTENLGLVSTLFTEDGSMTYSHKLQGKRAVHEFFSGSAGYFLGMSHNVTNLLIEVNGDTAKATSKALGWHWLAQGHGAREALPADLLLVGGYQDELRREPEGWRFVSRVAIKFGTGVGFGTVISLLRAEVDNMAKPSWPI